MVRVSEMRLLPPSDLWQLKIKGCGQISCPTFLIYWKMSYYDIIIKQVLLMMMAVAILKTTGHGPRGWQNIAANIIIIPLLVVFGIWALDSILWLALEISHSPFLQNSSSTPLTFIPTSHNIWEKNFFLTFLKLDYSKQCHSNSSICYIGARVLTTVLTSLWYYIQLRGIFWQLFYCDKGNCSRNPGVGMGLSRL